jgi:predicted lipoprotein with Yx(FWY)xxD motif
MDRFTRLVAAGLLLGAAACGERVGDETAVAGDSAAMAAAPPVTTPADSAATPAQGAAAVTVANSPEYGSYLADAEGRALYLFTADQPGQSSCSDACAHAWPPYLAPQGAPTAGSPDVQASLLGTLSRPDGTTQVVYNGHALYYFQKDTGPGQTTGQDVHAFGGEWYLVTPQGEKLEEGEGGGESS